ncbi:pirin family protein [Fodinicurvata fenggangensis]|uniref:pirin family protein n=1 Tax=Fodinicurvata fenggangensis TaxID=1121830 RepID=UPI00047A46B9|nr:pirin family protein [Fodinicurvata fenggangensis]
MIEARPFEQLGHFETGWLNAKYHFSFANYHDPSRMGVGPLRVWNDDTVAPGRGFDMHGHRDMEIITYVREGAITHQDHLGNEGRTEAGDVQVMSAGKGILHAEYNYEDKPTTLFQIWILPNQAQLKPHWETRSFPRAERAGELVPLASGRSHQDALEIHQDAALFGSLLKSGQSLEVSLEPARQAYLVLATGRVEVADADASPETLKARDGAVITDTPRVTVTAREDSELLLADLPVTQ